MGNDWNLESMCIVWCKHGHSKDPGALGPWEIPWSDSGWWSVQMLTLCAENIKHSSLFLDVYSSPTEIYQWDWIYPLPCAVCNECTESAIYPPSKWSSSKWSQMFCKCALPSRCPSFLHSHTVTVRFPRYVQDMAQNFHFCHLYIVWQ